MTMQAGLATMHQLTPDVYERLNDNGTVLRHQLDEMARSYRVPYVLPALPRSSVSSARISPVTDYRSAQGQDAVLRQKLFLHLLNTAFTWAIKSSAISRCQWNARNWIASCRSGRVFYIRCGKRHGDCLTLGNLLHSAGS